MGWLSGKKTYILAALGVVLAVLMATGAVTPDDLQQWNELLGVAMAWLALVVAALRDAVRKLGG